MFAKICEKMLLSDGGLRGVFLLHLRCKGNRSGGNGAYGGGWHGAQNLHGGVFRGRGRVLAAQRREGRRRLAIFVGAATMGGTRVLRGVDAR